MRTLHCWGANSHGQHGCGDYDDCCSPRQVTLPSDFTPLDITGGGAHTLLFGTDSESKPVLLSCGSNSHGQLGHSSAESSVSTWRQVVLSSGRFSSLSTTSDLFVRKVSAGWDFSAVVLENRKLLMWGSNHYGQLAQDLKTAKCSEPVHIEGLYADVACGMRHTVLLDITGTVYTCGAGRAGQLGTDRNATKSPVLTKVEFDPTVRPMKVAAGAYHSAAMTVGCQVYVWGSNKHGQCQQVSDMKSTNRPVLRFDLHAESEWDKNLMGCSWDDGQAPRAVQPTALISGWTHLALIVDDKTMFTWGRSDYGQLGRNLRETKSSDVPGIVGLKIKQAACGSEHVLALSLEAKVYCWGWNEHGMCGAGHETDVHEPTMVELPYKAVRVGAGAGHSFAICDDEIDYLCLITDAKQAQLLRDRLESRGLFDKRRRIEKVGDSVAIPITRVPENKYDNISYRVVSRALPKSKAASHKNWREKLLASLGSDFEDTDLPKHFERHGDLVLFQEDVFKGRKWEERFRYLPELWVLVKQSLGCEKLARKSAIKKDDFRSPQVELLAGNDGKVEQVDNGIKYTWDIQFCMFSAGNITEKLRVSSLNCHGETVVDLYAGIGYFTLPYLVHAGAARVHACEWNPHSVRFLKENLNLNHVSDRCEVYEGDNRKVAPRGVADRVNLGLIPTSSPGWRPACLALKRPLGGVLHVHQNVISSVAMATADPVVMATCDVAMDISTSCVAMTSNTVGLVASEMDYSKLNKTEFSKFICEKLGSIFQETYDEEWRIRVIRVETVKSYAPRIDHCVFDVDCRPPNMSGD